MSDQDPRDLQPDPAPQGPPTAPEHGAAREPRPAPGAAPGPAPQGPPTAPAPAPEHGPAPGSLGPPTQAGYGEAAYGDGDTAYGQGYGGTGYGGTAYGQGYGGTSYGGTAYGAGQAGFGGPAAPAAPGKPLDLARLVGIAAWVVVGLFGLWYLYFVSNDDNGGELVDRFFGGMDRLGEGLFYAGVLHAVSLWLGRNQDPG